MTFKHVKFEDSIVMRSLEKLAKEKGLVESEPITKSASQSLVPTNNLTENVLVLCDGLRQRGFTKQAIELEEKFLAYKQAQTLYETTSEKGEDLVDAAHPKGSYKLEDVDSDEAVVETILDRHMKMVKMIEKTPTGKLSSASQVINAVKMVLADAATKLYTETFNELKRQTNELDEKINSWALLPGSGTTDDTERKTDSLLSYVRSTLLNNKVTSESIDNSIKLINEVIASIGRTFWTKETDVARMLNEMKSYIDNFVRPEHLNSLSKPVETKYPFISQVDDYLSTLKNWTVAVNNDPENSPDDKKQAGDWIAARTNELNELRNKFRPEEADGFLVALNKSKFARESAQFKKTWIG